VRVVVPALALLFVVSVPASAFAQDAPLRACLLLRTPAQCGVGNPAPFTAPGDMQSLRVLRPDPMLRREREESKEKDTFTPARADVGAETTVEKHRQILSIPVAWNPFRAASLTADIPLVAQALTSATDYGIGDVAFGASARGAKGIFSYRLVAAGKLPTGDPAKGTGSGEVDGFGLGEAWLASGKWSGALSLAFRGNGRRDQPDVAQGSAAVQVDIPIGSFAEVGCQGRAFGHQVTGPTSGRSLYVALGIEPRIIGVAVGYAYLLIPVVDDTPFATGVVAAAGMLVPFGDKPKRPFVDTKEPTREPEPAPLPSPSPAPVPLEPLPPEPTTPPIEPPQTEPPSEPSAPTTDQPAPAP
jgi:hypothetical protein